MIKYFNKKGEEVKFGDVITRKRTVQTKYGTFSSEESITLNEDTVDYLIKRGFITSKEATPDVTDKVNHLIERFADILECSEDEALQFLATIFNINASSYYNMVMKELSNQIQDQGGKFNWFFSTATRQIVEATDEELKSTNEDYLALFPSYEQTKLAVEVADQLIELFDVSE